MCACTGMCVSWHMSGGQKATSSTHLCFPSYLRQGLSLFIVVYARSAGYQGFSCLSSHFTVGTLES